MFLSGFMVVKLECALLPTGVHIYEMYVNHSFNTLRIPVSGVIKTAKIESLPSRSTV